MKGDYRDYLESRNLRQYLRQISKFPALSRQEEKKMAELIQKGDKNALRKMIEANLKFVVSYVKKYRGLGMGLFDLINEGNLGLIEAAKRFDPERKVKFISYAVWWIRQAIIHALAQYSRAYYLPQRFSDKISEMKKKTVELKTELKREPTREEIAEKMGIDPEDVEELEMLSGREISLSDRYFDESKEEVGDRIKDNLAANTDDQIVKNSVQQRIRQMLSELDEKESLVLRLRFGMDDDTPQTLQEIGDKMKLTRERVRQIEKKAMRKLARSSKLQQLRGHLN